MRGPCDLTAVGVEQHHLVHLVQQGRGCRSDDGGASGSQLPHLPGDGGGGDGVDARGGVNENEAVRRVQQGTRQG